ncbi:MAG: hypothetical protein F6K19_23425 [Cyanothece sp. SIO1E1]|nr:hypothetical protein [Cyanothece sp. SIO1E1]
MSEASPKVTMKLPELKQHVWNAWEFLNEWKGQLLQPENFAADVKRFGDRRYKRTWVKALANFEAMNAHQNCLDAYMLILNDFNFTPDRWDYEYRHEILDAFLLYPDSLDLIKTGLEQLFSSDFTPKEQAEANGFFELVEERGGQSGRERLPVGLDRRLAAVNTAA